MTSFLPLLISNCYKSLLLLKKQNNIEQQHASSEQSELSVPDNSVITIFIVCVFFIVQLIHAITITKIAFHTYKQWSLRYLLTSLLYLFLVFKRPDVSQCDTEMLD